MWFTPSFWSRKIKHICGIKAPIASIFASKTKFVTPSDWSLFVLLFFVSIQLFFIVIVFARLIFYESPENEKHDREEGVSVIICAWNELENLRELLPMLESQDYPLYEVLVIDDRSTDGTEEFLEAYCRDSARVRTVRIKKEYDHITTKKYAVTIGQKHARYETSLMTDADCRPSGESWISSMMSRMGGRKEIVLGFSPYLEEKGLLNWFIRCETFYTAVQYFSFASYGMAYMGVGRNLMYRKELFFRNKGFYTHGNVLGGDDDLFINEVADSGNTACNLEPDSFMYSVPKSTWRAWFIQKKRHLGVGKFYRKRFKSLLGLLAVSHIFTWVAALVNTAWGVLGKDTYLLAATGVLFGARWLVQWLVLAMINRRLGTTVSSFFIPLMDFALFLYYLLMGGYNVFRKEQTARWR